MVGISVHSVTWWRMEEAKNRKLCTARGMSTVLANVIVFPETKTNMLLSSWTETVLYSLLWLICVCFEKCLLSCAQVIPAHCNHSRQQLPSSNAFQISDNWSQSQQFWKARMPQESQVQNLLKVLAHQFAPTVHTTLKISSKSSISIFSKAHYIWDQQFQFLPWSFDSACANASRSCSIRSANLFRIWDLSNGLFEDQIGKASLAALTAASTSKSKRGMVNANERLKKIPNTQQINSYFRD